MKWNELKRQRSRNNIAGRLEYEAKVSSDLTYPKFEREPVG